MNFDKGDVLQTSKGLIGLVVNRHTSDDVCHDKITILWKDATISSHTVTYEYNEWVTKIGTGKAEVEIIWSK